MPGSRQGLCALAAGESRRSSRILGCRPVRRAGHQPAARRCRRPDTALRASTDGSDYPIVTEKGAFELTILAAHAAWQSVAVDAALQRRVHPTVQPTPCAGGPPVSGPLQGHPDGQGCVPDGSVPVCGAQPSGGGPGGNGRRMGVVQRPRSCVHGTRRRPGSIPMGCTAICCAAPWRMAATACVRRSSTPHW